MIKLIFWDFDGTLADTIELVTGLFVKTASDYAGRAVTADEVRATFGLNERGTFRRLLGDQADQAFDDYLEYYIQAHNEISVFPGVRELLRDLKLQGTRNILVTGKGPECCEISLEKLKLMNLFDEIRPGFDDKADKAGEMLDAIEDFNVTPDQCVYIGDTVSDLDASRKAGIECLSAVWAPDRDVEALEKLNPGKVFATPEDLEAYLNPQLS